MPSLAELSDYYPQQDTTLPVASAIPANIPRVYINTAAPAQLPDMTQPITDARPEPLPEPISPQIPDNNGFWSNVGMAGVDDKSGVSENPIIKKLFGLGGEERYQTWPEKVVREALAAPHDVIEQGALPPGLRREDFTDKPVPNGFTVANSPADPLVNGAQAVSALAGTGGLAGVGKEAGAAFGVVPVDIAKKLNFKTSEAPEILKSAVENTPAASIDADGHLIVKMVRHQQSDQEGAESVRGGVFYLPEGSPNARHYNGSTNNYYGGQDKIEGQTAYKNPLVVKGATGGKAPEAAYNQLMGDKKAYSNLDKDVSEVVSASNWMKKKDPAAFDDLITRFFEKHNPEMLDYKDYVIDNSKHGNQLRYALSEGAIARAARVAGHDGIVGYSVGRGTNKGKPFLSEIFDTRESHYPSTDGSYRMHPEFYADNQAALGIQAANNVGNRAFLRPALKYENKIYKAPMGGQHLDALPAHLAEDFQTKAMNGEDINHYNFGFMNHKGQFLSREAALDYAVKEGLVDPSAGQYGALTSTLMADSSKPGTAIEAMAKTAPQNIDWNALHNIETSLSPEASKALTTWVGGPPGAKDAGQQFGIFDREGATKAFNDPKISKELETAFAPLKEQLKKEYGNNVVLYRYHGDIPENAKPHDVLSFTSDPKIPEWLSGAEKEKLITSEETIAKKEAEYNKSGKVQVSKNRWLEKKTETIVPQAGPNEGKPVEITYTAIMSPDGMVTDTDGVRAYFEQHNNWNKEDNLKRETKLGKIKSYNIPIDNIIGATDRFGQKEFIVRNKDKLFANKYTFVPVDGNPFEKKEK